MTTIDVIMGKSLSGKTTAMQTILNSINKPQLVQRLLTTTTRPKRQEDLKQVNYHFITNTELKKIRTQDPSQIIAKRTYQVYQDDQPTSWSYFINRQNLINDVNQTKHLILIIDWVGFNDLTKAIKADPILKHNYQIQGWYLNIPLKTRLERLTNSQSPRFNDDPKESLRRLYYDEFVDFSKLDQLVKNKQLSQIKVFDNDAKFIENYCLTVTKGVN